MKADELHPSNRIKRADNGEIKLKLVKEDERPVKSLSTAQIKQLLSACKHYPRLRIRILLALGTGLRRGDIETWRVSDLDFERGHVTTKSTKTRKSMSRQAKPGVSGHMEPYHEERYN